MCQSSILVVEDDSPTRQAIVEMLESFGYTCRTAANGLEALNLMGGDKFDMVLSNLHMPGLDGLELVAEVRKIAPDMPFIITSGYIEEHTYDRAFEAGAQDFIRKPFSVHELRARVDRVLKQRYLKDKVKRGIISLLLPYYLDEIFVDIYQDVGFEVLWADNREETEKIIMENEPDLAMEWQRGPYDFPIRDLLTKYGRRTPVILLLNWNGSLPEGVEDVKEVGCAGYANPFKMDEIIGQFLNVLPQEKRHILATLCAVAGVELKAVI